jgi:hypothetical protein
MIWEELRSRLAATMDIGEATTTLSLDIELPPLPTAEEIAAFAPATSDVFNTGVATILGCDYRYGFSSFVDDQGVATIRECLQEASHRSVIFSSISISVPIQISGSAKKVTSCAILVSFGIREHWSCLAARQAGQTC